MKRSKAGAGCSRSLFLIITLSLVASSATPQSGQNNEQAIKLGVDLVLLDVEAVNKKTGQAVGGLKKEDFLVYEDGVRQEITHFSQDKLPISALILLDVSGSVWPFIKELREAAREALQLLKPEDEAALMVFAGSVKLAVNFTKDKRKVAESLGLFGGDKLEGGTNHNTALLQAAAFMKNATSASHRRVIIAITDDVSTEKKPPPYSEARTLHEVLESGVVICGIFFDSIYRTNKSNRREKDLNPAAPQISLEKGSSGLVLSYVERTDGISAEVDKKNLQASLRENFTRLIERLRTRYSLGYTSTNEKRDGKFRKVRLRLSREAQEREGGATVSTRRGYYAKREGGDE
ncbi:MAG: VWA domain-containing protein [Acidobacteriota bacterium]